MEKRSSLIDSTAAKLLDAYTQCTDNDSLVVKRVDCQIYIYSYLKGLQLTGTEIYQVKPVSGFACVIDQISSFCTKAIEIGDFIRRKHG